MSLIITANKKQTKAYGAYRTDSSCRCACVTGNKKDCRKTDGIRDWTYGYNNCCWSCQDTRKCSKPSPVECTLGKNVQGEKALVGVKWNGSAPNITCSYDAIKLNTWTQLVFWSLQHPETPAPDVLVSNICAGLSQYSDGQGEPPPNTGLCQNNPNTGSRPDVCSIIRTQGEYGDFCRTWYGDISAGQRDAFNAKVCGAYPGLEECACVERKQNPEYAAVAAGYPFLDSCWYLPCKETVFNLIPSALLNTGSCPANVCSQLLQVVDSQQVDIAQESSSIDCEFDAKERTYSCEDGGCFVSGCGTPGVGNCYADASCDGKCPPSTTYKCIGGTCEPAACDPSDPVNGLQCFTNPGCNGSCGSVQGYRMVGNNCVKSTCNVANSGNCFADDTCGGRGIPPGETTEDEGLPTWAFIVIAIGAVILVVAIAIGVYFGTKKKKLTSAASPGKPQALVMATPATPPTTPASRFV